jgi:hypothetical protein
MGSARWGSEVGHRIITVLDRHPLGDALTAWLLDSPSLRWWSAPPEPPEAIAEVAAADHLAVASISWFEMAWLAENERTLVNVPTNG